MYALTAATKSKNLQRCRVATEILNLIREDQREFVDEACLFNDELIRCAILWHEMWHGTLEEASRLYFQVRVQWESGKCASFRRRISSR